MNELQCIFTDLDGTLLNNNHKIMPKTKQILCEMYHNHVTIVPVSARMPSSITPIMDAISTKLPLIAYNGAYAINSNREPIISFIIDEKTSLKIYQYVISNYPDVCICVYYQNDWIVDDIKDPRIQTEIKAVGLSPKEIPIPAYIIQKGMLHKLFIVGDPKRTDRLVDEINSKWNNVFACKSRDIFIEITSCQASKGNAVKEFADKLKISLNKSVAFGDQINDIDMLNAVGTGVAMGNAAHEVKDAAKFITASNEEEGIYEFLSSNYYK